MSPRDLYPPQDFRSQRRRRLLQRFQWTLGVLLVLLLIPVIWGVLALMGSRPQLDGEVRLAGLERPVSISRDALGIPTILSDNRNDAAEALGFLHAQERFFQMDLLRRRAAGELAELLGAALIDQDKSVRLHRFRAVARANLEQLNHRDVAEAYTRGVNAGLAALRSRPFEYLLLRSEPEPWLPEDIFLVVHSMYLDLQGSRAAMEMSLAVVQEQLPQEMAAFISSPGTAWDAPLAGELLALPSIPQADVFDLRSAGKVSVDPQRQAQRSPTRPAVSPLDRRVDILREEDTWAGSNGWAVSGERSATGHALLAGDMHLGLAVPNIWYRTTISFRDSTSAQGRRLLSGFTLPGAPLMVVGSNGDLAWCFTAANVDQSDIVVLESTGGNSYQTPDGPRQLQSLVERIDVKGGEPEQIIVHQSIWGPVVRIDSQGRKLVQKWIAHDPAGVNFGLLEVEQATNVAEGLYAMTRTAVPGLNCVMADAQGHIAWTVAGFLPKRRGLNGRLPTSWADGKRGWDGFLAPGDVPRVVDPVGGQLWSANHRHVTGRDLQKLGEGGYVLAARATQIRDALSALPKAAAADMLALQLDDRAVLLDQWQALLMNTLTTELAQQDPRLTEMRSLVASWGGHASIQSVGYRLVRNFRFAVSDELLESILASCIRSEPGFRIWHLREREQPVWRILQERPMHLLPMPYESWDQFLVSMATATRDALEEIGPLHERTWGERNTTRIQHPLSLAVPALGRWLDMPAVPLPGDGNVPRMQSPTWGASQRMVVVVGDETHSIAHMPVGQSGHPLSPYYRSSHAGWMQGSATPLLPGEVEHTLQLLPE